jgi:hypothetical protein
VKCCHLSLTLIQCADMTALTAHPSVRKNQFPIESKELRTHVPIHDRLVWPCSHPTQTPVGLCLCRRRYHESLTPALKTRMAEGGGELPISYAAGLMSFPEPLRLRAKPRQRKGEGKYSAGAGAR